MKKESIHCILWFSIFLLGITFTISAALLQTLPNSSKSALLLFSICFIIIGLIASAVHYRKYVKIKTLIDHHAPVLAHWTYDISSSSTLKAALSEQKSNTISTAILSLILGIIFSLVFAYSGGTHILYTGYTLAILIILAFIIGIRCILTYYEKALKIPTEVIFGEDSIYFMNQLYGLQKSIYFLENVIITQGPEAVLQLVYGQYDIDDTPTCIISIPIPANKLQVAEHLRKYYLDLIAYE
ncbi:hypothetical protein [Cellulosilyticum sp. WCF-2]|uniref:hypothetical protein n=1 Tax=Cellulosilyticum sp. WCF-2 TaxID=2497860 RepID=UPI000F8E16FD|nr:hypothetical protein [Cellulosilyticum sp. WCF-2]QEH66912.1 hypothetical protein EKH84_00130 [Cellulosilyticum sp. WCF-2]